MPSIFAIWREIQKVLPFVVRRSSWRDAFGLLVVRIEPKGSYGKAYGFSLPPLDGTRLNDYWGLPGSPKEISCAGCGQWELITEIPEREQWNKVIQEYSMKVDAS